MKVTRRSLAGILAAPALLTQPIQAQAPAPPAAAPDAAQTRYSDAAREIAAVKLPMSTEPASKFEA